MDETKPYGPASEILANIATWQAEYQEINQNFRMLAEIRFKLLALVPTLGGAAIFLLSKMAAGSQASSPDSINLSADHATVVFVSALGFLATLGITFYDQRNSELYGLLVSRGGDLELMINPPLRNFKGRKKRGRYLLGIVPMGHDSGLALIYSPVLGAWFYPMMSALLRWRGCTSPDAPRIALLTAALVSLIFWEEFLRLDGFWKKKEDVRT